MYSAGPNLTGEINALKAAISDILNPLRDSIEKLVESNNQVLNTMDKTPIVNQGMVAPAGFMHQTHVHYSR